MQYSFKRLSLFVITYFVSISRISLLDVYKRQDEEYKEFYRKVFMDYKEPLFWIHLNMDYPFNLKGILYFPKINTEYDSIEGTIKLYNNQVFIADNIKEVIPEFLLLLKGVIDCPDLPLNVSRSAPVSYTHLDVYKRQVCIWETPEQTCKLEKQPGCTR